MRLESATFCCTIYIVVYLLFCDTRHIHIIKRGAIHTIGWMYQENCNCPNMNSNEWLEALQCPKSYDQLDEDLNQFSTINMRLVEKEVARRWPKKPGQGALMHYVIKDGKVCLLLIISLSLPIEFLKYLVNFCQGFFMLSRCLF